MASPYSLGVLDNVRIAREYSALGGYSEALLYYSHAITQLSAYVEMEVEVVGVPW
jgi:hypothetical protein